MKQGMLTSLFHLVDALEKSRESTAKTEALYMDLMESVVRHLAVVAIAAYRNNGCRNDKINREISKQLPLPTFGSWKNIIQLLTGSNKSEFPEGFHNGFLAILATKPKEPSISIAYAKILQLIDLVTSEKKEMPAEGQSIQCTYLQFLDAMVGYRNRFKGHGTNNMPSFLVESVDVIRDGVVAFCRTLHPLWLEYPLLLSRRGTLGGETFHTLRPLLTTGGIDLEITEDSIKENQLYICLNKAAKKVETLFPLAIWHDEDVMFYNGTKDFKTILYFGFNALASTFGTDKFEKQFCMYLISFYGWQTLDTIDLDEHNALQYFSAAPDREWKFPKLKKGQLLGNRNSKHYILEQKLHTGVVSETWKATVIPGNNESVAIKFLHDCQYWERFYLEARVLRTLSEKSKKIPQFYAFLLDPHPSMQVPYIVMECLSDKSLETMMSERKYIDVQESIVLLEKALEALAPIHRGGMVYRNISPSALMFDTKGDLKLGDMGLVCYGEAEQPEMFTEVRPVQTEDAMGVIEFASPEQLEHKTVGNGLTHKSDLYSIGAAFYKLLTGQYPYGEGNAAVVVKNQTNVNSYSPNAYRVHPVTDSRPECPEFLNSLLMRLLNVDPDLRPDADTIRSEILDYRRIKAGEKSNETCNLLGEINRTDIRFHGLMPKWLTKFMLKVWPAILFVEVIVAVILSIKFDVFLKLDIFKFVDAHHNFIVYPLARDKVFIIWHLMPIVFIFILFRIIKSVQPIMKEIFSLDHNRDGEHWISSKRRNDAWAKILHNRFVFAGIACIAIFQCFTTYNKVLHSLTTGIFYWSDWRVSIWTFLLKELLVCINTFGIIYYIIFICGLIDIFTYILRGTKLRLDLSNSDNQSGLLCIRKLLLLFLPFFLIFSYGLSAVLVADFGQNKLHTLEQIVGILVITVLYFAFIIWPIYPIHRHIRQARDIELNLFKKRRISTENSLKKYLTDEGALSVEQTSNLLSLSALKRDLLKHESTTLGLHVWPINRTSIALLCVIGILPLLYSSAFLLLKSTLGYPH